MKKNKDNKKKLSYRAKYRLLMSGSILTTITPLLIVMAFNYKAYFTVKYKATLYIGLILALIFIIVSIFSKLKMQRIMWLGIVFGIAIFFESVFKDIVMLTGALFGGGVLDRIFFYGKVKRYEKLADYKDQADIQAESQKEVNKDLVNTIVGALKNGGGRV